MTQESSPSESALNDYRTATRLLMARRVLIAAPLFLTAVAVASGFEWLYHPERFRALVVAYVAYVAIALAQLLVVRRRPALSIVVTVGAINWLAMSLSIYFGSVHGGTETLLLSLVLLLTGVAVLCPWGLQGQLCASGGVLLGYPLALALGARPTLPAPYEMFALVTAIVVATLGAAVLERYRRASFEHEADLRGLLQVARVLDATIRDPRAVAEQLTEHARRALGADWAMLYQKDADDGVFRVTSCTRLPEPVAAELRSLEFSPAGASGLYQLQQESGADTPDTPAWTLPLRRWGVSAVLLETLKADQAVTGFLGCCYTGRTEPFTTRERELLCGIASHGSVALENARLMEDARRANQLRFEFAATVAHELRTPLSVIVGYTDVLLDEASEAQRDMLERIHAQSAQLNDLIQAMLDLNRLETGRLPIHQSEFTLGEAMAELRTNLPAAWCADGVDLCWEVQDAGVVLRSDRGKLQMILRNLIHNALKFTEKGSVTIAAVRRANSEVVFSVRDTGAGIGERDQAAIFQMFRQGNATAPRGGGVGLGLYIVMRLTHALGGQVSLESRDGAGAQFTVVLPIDFPPAASVPSPTPVEVQSRARAA